MPGIGQNVLLRFAGMIYFRSVLSLFPQVRILRIGTIYPKCKSASPWAKYAKQVPVDAAKRHPTNGSGSSVLLCIHPAEMLQRLVLIGVNGLSGVIGTHRHIGALVHIFPQHHLMDD